jgi:hypothetical protein
MSLTLKQRSDWVLWLYDQLTETNDEDEANHMVALIDQEEGYLIRNSPVDTPPLGKLLQEIKLDPPPVVPFDQEGE